MSGVEDNRRGFIKTGVIITLSGAVGWNMLGGCKSKDGDEGQKVSPAEDLMQEHGLLNRVLLIYDTCKMHLINKETFPKDEISNAAGIIRTFIEDFHEKHEENYYSPVFKKQIN
jgi:hypothetical protein